MPRRNRNARKDLIYLTLRSLREETLWLCVKNILFKTQLTTN